MTQMLVQKILEWETKKIWVISLVIVKHIWPLWSRSPNYVKMLSYRGLPCNQGTKKFQKPKPLKWAECRPTFTLQGDLTSVFIELCKYPERSKMKGRAVSVSLCILLINMRPWEDSPAWINPDFYTTVRTTGTRDNCTNCTTVIHSNYSKQENLPGHLH